MSEQKTDTNKVDVSEQKTDTDKVDVSEQKTDTNKVDVSEQKTDTSRDTSRDANRDANRDTIFIGKKPLMAYVTSTLIQLANLSKVSIKARGMSIGRAVDVAQIIARKTENAGYAIGEIKIGSEQLESRDGRQRNVSTIDIEVKRNTT